MSAIAGIYYLDNRPVAGQDLSKMAASLAHRGPDAGGVWVEAAVGLANRLLWTTPESLHEQLPLVSQHGNLVLTADARLDNRAELLAQLDLAGRPAAQITDSDLILAAYERWGEQCPINLIGDFAFAIWDKQRQTLFCARDHFGVRPFYYYHSGHIFAFASEIKALTALPQVSRWLNEQRVAEYLTGSFDDTAVTFYQDILRLPPAHTITVSPVGVKTATYWALDPQRELRLNSDEEYAEAYRELFTEAVRCRLRSAYPNVGALLSGGLDSSSITCTARDLLAGAPATRLHTFSSLFTGVARSDERPFMDAVITQGGVEPHFIRGDQLSPLNDLERVMWHQDEAFYAYNLFIVWELCRQAQGNGVRVLLDGMLGDTTIPHGQPYITELAYTGQWLTMTRELKHLSDRYNYKLGPAVWGNIWQNGLKPRVPHPVRRLRPKFLTRSQPGAHPAPILRSDFVRGLNLERPAQAAGQVNAFKQVPVARWSHYQELSEGILPFALEIANKTAAAFSLELRYPFSDKRLIEFCLALPPQQKLQHGWPRSIVRRALTNLPDEVRWRPRKGDLSYNFKQGLLTHEKQRLDDIILRNSHVLEPYVNLKTLRGLYQHLLDSGQQANNQSMSQLWLAFTLALWLRYAQPAARSAKNSDVLIGKGSEGVWANPQPVS